MSLAFFNYKFVFYTFSIYEKLINFCNIDEFGTNFSKEQYDPHGWDGSSFYDELAKAQKIEMDKRTKERQTKVLFGESFFKAKND